MNGKGRSCQARTEVGVACRAKAQAGSSFCFFHDPDSAESREAAQRSGGQSRSRPAAVLPTTTADPKLETVTDVAGLLADTICRVRKGELDARIANTVGYLAGVMIRALEGADLERRIEELEETVRASKSAAAGFDAEDPPLPASLSIDGWVTDSKGEDEEDSREEDGQ